MSNEEHSWLFNVFLNNSDIGRKVDETISDLERLDRARKTLLETMVIPGGAVSGATGAQGLSDRAASDNMQRASERLAQQRSELEGMQASQAAASQMSVRRIEQYGAQVPNIEMLGEFQRMQVELAGVNNFLREQYQLLSANAAVSRGMNRDSAPWMNPAAGRITSETSTFDPANPSDFQLYSDQVRRLADLKRQSAEETWQLREAGGGAVAQNKYGGFTSGAFPSDSGAGQAASSMYTQQEGIIQRVRGAFNDLNETLGGVDSRFLHHARAIVELIVIYKGIEMAISTLQKVFELQSQLSDAAARYSVITGQSAEASQRNIIALQGMAAQYGILPSEVSKGSAEIAQFTKNLDEQQKVASAAAALSRLSGETFAQSVDRLTASLQANNLTAADSGRILDLVLTMYRAVPSTIEEDIQVVEKLGAASERTGMGLEAISVLAARVAQRAAVTPTSAANAIERIPGALETQSALQGMIKEGISPFVSGTTQLRPFIDLLTEIGAKYNELNAAGNTSQANRLVESIIGNRPESLRGFVAVLEEINKGMPPIVEHTNALGTIMDSMPSKVDLIKTHWEQLLQAMGKAPPTNALLDWIDQAVAHAAQLVELQNKVGDTNIAANVGAALRQGQINPLQAYTTMAMLDMTSGKNAGVTGMDFWGGFFNPQQAISKGSSAYHQYDSSNAPDALEFQNQMTRTMGATSSYASAAAGGGTTGGNSLQALYNSGIGNTQFLSLVNQTALSQQQFNDLQTRSIQMTNQQLALWKEYLMSIGFSNDAAEEHLQKLRQQADVASVLVNVEGRAQLVTGPAANQFGAAYGQMNQQQEGLQRLNFGEQYLPMFDQLVAKFRALLSQVGLDEKGVPTVEAVGKDQVTLLRQSLFYQQASSMALAEIERLTKEHTTGLYNFPRGYTPYVPYQAGDLDVSTRLGQGSGLNTGNIKVQPDPTVQAMLAPFYTGSVTFSNATTKFSEAVTRMMAQEDAKDRWLAAHGVIEIPSDTGSGTTSGGRRERGANKFPENPDYGLNAGPLGGSYHDVVPGRTSAKTEIKIPVTYTAQTTFNILIGDVVIETITRSVLTKIENAAKPNIGDGATGQMGFIR